MLFLTQTVEKVNYVTIGQLFSLLANSPLIVITILLALAVVFINGWTDAPNAVATCVSTRAISAKKREKTQVMIILTEMPQARTTGKMSASSEISKKICLTIPLIR